MNRHNLYDIFLFSDVIAERANDTVNILLDADSYAAFTRYSVLSARRPDR